MEKGKKLLRSFLGIPVTIFAFLFIGKIFFDNRVSVMHSLAALNVPLFLLGILFLSVFFAIKSFVWMEILNKRGFIVNDKRKMLLSYSFSEVKRYIPGSIFAFIGRMDAFSHSVPRKETLKGIGIEALLLALSSLFISIPAIAYLLFKAREEGSLPYFVPVGVAVLLLVICTAFIFSKFKKTIFAYFESFLLLLLAWTFYAAGCFLIAVSITYMYPDNLVFILSFFVLSWLSGYLLFITPMGLGIRELAVTGSLALFVASPVASVIAILTRLGMVLGELLYLLVCFLVSKLKDNSRVLKINPFFAIILFTALLYFLYFTTFTFQRHDAFLSGRFDLGNMTQTVWNTAHGNFFTLTDPDGTKIVSRLAVHSDYFLVFFAPIYLLWSDPKVLLVFQTLFLASGGLFVFLIARHVLNNDKLSFALSISYYLNFWLHEQNIFDFHAVSLATPLLLACFYFLLKKRYILFSIFLILAALTKENVILVASVFGLYFLVLGKKRVVGTLLLVAPLLLFYFVSFVAIPSARGEEHFVLENYKYTQNLDPIQLIKQIVNFSTVTYFFHHLLPTGFLALLSPFFLIFALPDVAIYLLSSNFEYRSYQYHFGAVIIPFIYISSIYSVKYLLKQLKKYPTEKIFFYYIIGTALLSAYLFSPLPGMNSPDYAPYKARGTQKISEYIAIIPDNASVSASNNIGAHLSHRKEIFVIPLGITKAEYVVLYAEKIVLPGMIDAQNYDLVIKDKVNNFYMFRKKLPDYCKNCTP